MERDNCIVKSRLLIWFPLIPKVGSVCIVCIVLICYLHISWKITYFQSSRDDKSWFLCSLLGYPSSLCGTGGGGATVLWWCLARRVVTVNILGSLAKRQNFIWKFCLCPLGLLRSQLLLLHFLDIRSKMKAQGTQSCIGPCTVRSLADLSVFFSPIFTVLMFCVFGLFSWFYACFFVCLFIDCPR